MRVISPVIRFFRFTWATLVFTLKQLFAQRGLTIASLLGLLTATSIAMSIPIYADAVYQDVLETQLSGDEGEQNQRPPFSFMFRYIGSWAGPVAYEKTQPADEYLAGLAVQDLNLPLKLFVRYYKTGDLRLFSGEESNYDSLQQNLAFISVGMVSSLEEHATLVEGNLPSAQLVDERVEVLVNEDFANDLGLQSGEDYTIFERVKTELGEVRVEIPVRISGVWKATNPDDPFWFYSLSEFDSVLLTHPNAFTEHILPALNNEVNLALWYLVMDGSGVKSSDVSRVIGRIFYTRQRVFNYLQGVRMDISPLEQLGAYQQKARNLSNFLYSFSVPLLGMVLSFISLVSAMAIQQRRSQIATLRSRGATAFQMMGMAAFEGSLLGLFSLLLGIPLAMAIAYSIGRTRSFLDFSANTHLSLRLPETAWQIGIVVMLFTLAAQVLPVLEASKHTIVTYKQERARQVRPAWWQRAWLDVLLLIPTGYGIYLIKKPGGNIAGMPNDPFQNPLLMLLPALGIFGLTLILLRLLPRMMRAIAWITGHTSGVGALLAARHLERMGSGFHAPLILLVFTLSLSTFTASMAQTLDQYLYDKNYYETGADLSLDETGEANVDLMAAAFGGGPSSAGSSSAQGQAQETELLADEPRWFFLPVSEHLKVPGIQAAARIGTTQARIDLPGRSVQGRFLGIDRVDFPQVSFWRDDFASQPLGALMNNLALTTEGALIPRSLFEEYAFRPGDAVDVTVYMLGESHKMEMKIVGVFDLFPTWYPNDGPLVVGNLDYLYEQFGGEFPYDVWVNTAPGANYDGIVKGLEGLDIIILYWRVAEERLTTEQLRPERQGLFGLLSVGFLALAFLTVLGFFLYALFSFRSRFIELGMLRALGLSARQLVVYLAAELVFLLLMGLGVGTGLGVWASNLFIPILQMGSGPETQIPPFVIQIDWFSVFRIYILFALLFVTALGTLSALLLRMKIFQAIKLGEAV